MRARRRGHVRRSATTASYRLRRARRRRAALGLRRLPLLEAATTFAGRPLLLRGRSLTLRPRSLLLLLLLPLAP